MTVTPIISMTGSLVALGPLGRELLPLLHRWENDILTNEVSGASFAPVSLEQVSAAWMPLIEGRRPGWAGFVIYTVEGLRPIGHCNVRDFGTANRTAEFGITIGDPADRGRGYGTEATRLALEYAFTRLGVHNVWLDTVSSNLGAIRAYEKAGFREIGRIREARRIGGRVVDVVLMDCLATEFPATG